MKRILIFTLSFFLLSCSSTRKLEQFNNILGQENSQAYKLIIQDFETNKLKKLYPNLNTDKAYRNLLKDILDRNIEISNLHTEKGKKLYQNKLENELNCSADSVWIDRDIPSIKIRRKCLDGETKKYNYRISEILTYMKNKNEDSLISEFEKFKTFNYDGNYLKALKAVPNKSKFLSGYIEMKDAAGDIAFYIIAEIMLENEVSLSDPINKRILFTEVIYY